MFSFAQPLWILFGALACLLIWLLWSYQDRTRRKNLERFVAAPLLENLTENISAARRTIKKLLVLGAVFCCFLSLARPQYGYHWVDVKHKGIDILFALDTSKSMLAEDIRPNRLERSKYAVLDFVSQLTGDRVGLMPFAGTSYLLCPLTADYQAFEQSLGTIDTAIIPLGGTDIRQAIISAETIVNNEANHKILILITDGENLEGDAVAAAAEAHKRGMIIHTVGVGTEGGELIPDHQAGGFVKDQDGSYVKSRLDEDILDKIAESAGGMYVPLGSQGQGLETIYQEKLALVPKTELSERRKKVPIQRFEWPLAAAILFLAAEYIVSGRRRQQSLSSMMTRLARRRKNIAGMVILAMLFSWTHLAAYLYASEGEDAYNASEFIKAAEYYHHLLKKDPDNAKILYNAGTTAYKNNLYDEAIGAFEKAILTDDLELQKKAFYNKGNALFRKGEETEQSEPQKTIATWEQSLEAYMQAMNVDPEDENARFNHDFVKKKLDQLQKQAQQQQQSQEEKSKDNQSPEDKQDQNGADQTDQQTADNKTDQNKQQPSQNSNPQDNPADQQENGESERAQQQAQENNTSSEEHEMEEQIAHASAENEVTEQQAQETAPPQKDAHSAMTKEEAEQLLQTVQGEEGRLNLFVPATSDKETRSRRDW